MSDIVVYGVFSLKNKIYEGDLNRINPGNNLGDVDKIYVEVTSGNLNAAGTDRYSGYLPGEDGNADSNEGEVTIGSTLYKGKLSLGQTQNTTNNTNNNNNNNNNENNSNQSLIKKIYVKVTEGDEVYSGIFKKTSPSGMMGGSKKKYRKKTRKSLKRKATRKLRK